MENTNKENSGSRQHCLLWQFCINCAIEVNMSKNNLTNQKFRNKFL